MKGLDAWITGNYGEDHPDNTAEREPEWCGPNRRYGIATADGPISLVFCDHCTKTTTNLSTTDGDIVTDDEPCDECNGGG